jgi:hypothetical protein
VAAKSQLAGPIISRAEEIGAGGNFIAYFGADTWLLPGTCRYELRAIALYMSGLIGMKQAMPGQGESREESLGN